MYKKFGFFLFLVLSFFIFKQNIFAQIYNPAIDNDFDGLSNYEEQFIYFTNPDIKDTDKDGYFDGEEVKNNYDPNVISDIKIEKTIVVNLKSQSLEYKLGSYIVGSIKISSGVKNKETPKGEFEIIKKRLLVDYIGQDYNYPKTKWNLLFKYNSKGNYYIHGAYWHNKFGKVMSHGCVNVSYKDMEILYNWADEGIKIFIN